MSLTTAELVKQTKYDASVFRATGQLPDDEERALRCQLFQACVDALPKLKSPLKQGLEQVR